MRNWLNILRSAPIGMTALLAVAIVLYGGLLASGMTPLGHGEEAFSHAWAGFLLTCALWIVLALMLIVGAVMGRMPLWAGIIAPLLHPLSGLAAFAALDAVSRRVGGEIVVLVLLPPLIAGYAFWARMPPWRDRYPPGPVSGFIWAAVALISGGALAAAM